VDGEIDWGSVIANNEQASSDCLHSYIHNCANTTCKTTLYECCSRFLDERSHPCNIVHVLCINLLSVNVPQKLLNHAMIIKDGAFIIFARKVIGHELQIF
jgi:hypothetical protein